ncbi:MAG TPA: TIGR03618 family F420-dependent PPOX class oxidoreductase [Chloroflexota bacterium]|nr:TIGR03618 family F420-dependent PPOX class oxidoreductase [Chloroflexota bacterium]
MKLTPDDARAYLKANHRAFLITRRRNGGLQSTLVHAQTDGEGHAVVWARGSTAKLKNLHRDPRAALSVLGEQGSAPWMHIEGQAEVVAWPDSKPLLDDYHRIRHGQEHANWDEYHAQMEREQRAIIRITIETALGG